MNERLWTPGEEGTLRELRAQGVRVKEIAKRMGRPPGAVARRACELGIRLRRTRKGG